MESFNQKCRLIRWLIRNAGRCSMCTMHTMLLQNRGTSHTKRLKLGPLFSYKSLNCKSWSFLVENDVKILGKERIERCKLFWSSKFSWPFIDCYRVGMMKMLRQNSLWFTLISITCTAPWGKGVYEQQS